jgi:hypothetical protein
MNHRTLLLALIAGLLFGVCSSAHATGLSPPIYRCDSPGGGPALFSQFPCADDSEAIRVDPVQTFATPPLGEAEQRWLDGLARERQEQAARRARDVEREAKAQRRQEAERHQRCEAARESLLALARQRRKGYTLTELPALERREAELLALRREQC